MQVIYVDVLNFKSYIFGGFIRCIRAYPLCCTMCANVYAGGRGPASEIRQNSRISRPSRKIGAIFIGCNFESRVSHVGLNKNRQKATT